MKTFTIESSPRLYARVAGAIYLLIILGGGFSEGYVMNTLVVAGDSAATAHNIMASSTLWRFSVAGDLIVPLIAVPQLWIIFNLLKPAGKTLALLFVLLEIVSLSVESVSKLFLLLILPVLGSAAYGAAFQPQQLDALVAMMLSAHDVCFNIALLFFGADCLVTGYLVFKSGYFPRIIGRLLQLAGLSYLVGTLSLFFVPTLGGLVSLPAQLVALIGEASFCLWLLVIGLDVAKWNERVAVARAADSKPGSLAQRPGSRG